MFDNLCCLTDAVSAIDCPPNRSESQMIGLRFERLHSVSSVTSLSSFSGHESPIDSPSLPITTIRSCKVQRKRISPEQTNVLQGLFESGIHFPNREMRDRLSNELDLSPRTIQVWFQNRRQAARNKARGMERPPPGHKLSIRWMKPCVFPEVANDLQERPERKAGSFPSNSNVNLYDSAVEPFEVPLTIPLMQDTTANLSCN